MMSAESNSEKSVSYQKKDGRSHTCPSFFSYENDKDLKVCFLVTRLNYIFVLYWYAWTGFLTSSFGYLHAKLVLGPTFAQSSLVM